MKIIKTVNTFAISLPFIILFSYPFFGGNSVVYSLLSTMITGFIQVVLSIYLFCRKYKQEKIIIYLVCVATFFIAWFIVAQINGLNALGSILLIVPPTLACYLSYIIYSKN